MEAQARKTIGNWSSFSPKTTFYFANGTGRDGYIHGNNGGLCHAKENKTQFELGSFNMKKQHADPSPIIHAKGLYYHSDGTGRDSYVVISSGGMHRDFVAGEFKNNFYHSLRTYPHFAKNSRSLSPKKKEAKMFTTMQHFNRSGSQFGQIHKYQMELDKRLSIPKPYYQTQMKRITKPMKGQMK